MVWKKTWFSYIIWVIFTLTGAGIFFCGAGDFCSNLPMSDGVSLILIPILIVILFAGCVIALSMLVNRFESGKGSERSYDRLQTVLECVSFILIIAAGIAVRCIVIPVKGPDAFFESAQILQDGEIFYSPYGIKSLYVKCLQILFLLFGNKWSAGIVFQVILQFTAAVILYFSLRKKAGRIAALCMFAVVSLLPGSVSLGLHYGTEMLFLVFFALGLVWVLQELKPENYSRGSVLFYLDKLFLGIYLGGLVYLDIWGILLVVLLASGLWVHREERGSAVHCICGKFITFLVAAGTGFSGCIFLHSVLTGQEFYTALTEWLAVYSDIGFAGSAELYEMLFFKGYLLVGLLLLGCSIVFVFSRKENAFDGWFLMFIFTCVFTVFRMSCFSKTGYTMLTWLIPVLGGIGIRELFTPERVVKEAGERIVVFEKKEKVNYKTAYNPALFEDANERAEDGSDGVKSYISTTSQPLPVRPRMPEKPEVQETKILSDDGISAEIIEEPLMFQPMGEPVMEDDGLNTEVTDDLTFVSLNDVDTEEKKPVRLIPNPLPGPKKHVKKTMDFDVIPGENEMFFDVEIQNDDDFDIK